MNRVKKAVVSAVSLTALLISLPAEAVSHFLSRWLMHADAPLVFTIREALAETLATVEDAIKTMLAGADEIVEEVKKPDESQRRNIEKKAKLTLEAGGDSDFHFYVGKKLSAAPIGYVVLDTVQGKWGPIRYAVQFDPAGKVHDVLVLEYQEQRGRPIASRRFLKQFIGKSTREPLRLQKDIRGVTGATISSRAMTDGIRKLTFVFKEFYGGSSS